MVWTCSHIYLGWWSNKPWKTLLLHYPTGISPVIHLKQRDKWVDEEGEEEEEEERERVAWWDERCLSSGEGEQVNTCLTGIIDKTISQHYACSPLFFFSFLLFNLQLLLYNSYVILYEACIIRSHATDWDGNISAVFVFLATMTCRMLHVLPFLSSTHLLAAKSFAQSCPRCWRPQNKACGRFAFSKTVKNLWLYGDSDSPYVSGALTVL